jgi:hypothetical protein
MKKPSTPDQELAELKTSGLPSIQLVQAEQEKMLRLLKRSQADPVSYAGLEYCTAEYCGRVNCSEACWFGSLRGRSEAEAAFARLLQERKRDLQEALIVRPKWNRRYGELHRIDGAVGKRLVRRVLDGINDRRIVAVGTFKVCPFGYNNHGSWICEIHIVVAGTTRPELESWFREKPPQVVHDVHVARVKDLSAAIKRVPNCNEPAAPKDRHYVGQRHEFYSWLLAMKVGSRKIRYGCD